MKIAYFDCFSGISGDMVLSALVDAGLNFDILKEELQKLPITNYKIKSKKTIKKGIACTKVSVITEAKTESSTKMIELIEKSSLSGDIKQKSKEIIERIEKAEAKVHGKINSKIKDVYFHELSSIDTIIDVVGAVIGIKQLGIDKVYSSSLNVGSGMIKIKHGILPAPGPATCELLKGVPVYSNGIKKELTTPTGAAIITTFATEFGHLPEMKIDKIGYGAGDFELEEQANLLRVIIGKAKALHSRDYEEDMVTLIETNIDDLSPEIYEYCFEQLFNAGALDVYLTPIIMKKSRPGIILSVISASDKVDELTSIIFKETSSIGVRLYEVRRIKLHRHNIKINTEFGKIEAKKVIFEGKTKIIPEYEVCKKIAKEKGIPLKEIYSKIVKFY
jgi:hypothetical protein